MEKIGFANGNPNIVLDLGNSLVKMVSDTRPHYEICFPHARVEVNSPTYDRLSNGNSGMDEQYQFIKWNDRHFIIGEDAYSAGTVIPQFGRQKYSKEYYGVIFVSGLLRIFQGDVPGKVNVFAAHPPGDYEQVDALKRSIIGSWSIDNLGKKIKFKVEYVNVFDEIVGGAMNVVLAPDGRQYNDHPIVEDGPTIVCDLGGGTFDIVRLKRDGTVDYSRIGSVRIGINTAVTTFKSLFEKKYPELLDDAVNGVPEERVYEAFINPKHAFKYAGQDVDCKDIYDRSITSLVNAVREAYRDMGKGSIHYNHALITGGGGGLLFTELSEKVFSVFADGGVLYQADKRSQMHLANVRGAAKLLVPLSEISKRSQGKR